MTTVTLTNSQSALVTDYVIMCSTVTKETNVNTDFLERVPVVLPSYKNDICWTNSSAGLCDVKYNLPFHWIKY